MENSAKCIRVTISKLTRPTDQDQARSSVCQSTWWLMRQSMPSQSTRQSTPRSMWQSMPPRSTRWSTPRLMPPCPPLMMALNTNMVVDALKFYLTFVLTIDPECKITFAETSGHFSYTSWRRMRLKPTEMPRNLESIKWFVSADPESLHRDDDCHVGRGGFNETLSWEDHSEVEAMLQLQRSAFHTSGQDHRFPQLRQHSWLWSRNLQTGNEEKCTDDEASYSLLSYWIDFVLCGRQSWSGPCESWLPQCLSWAQGLLQGLQWQTHPRALIWQLLDSAPWKDWSSSRHSTNCQESTEEKSCMGCWHSIATTLPRGSRHQKSNVQQISGRCRRVASSRSSPWPTSTKMTSWKFQCTSTKTLMDPKGSDRVRRTWHMIELLCYLGASGIGTTEMKSS